MTLNSKYMVIWQCSYWSTNCRGQITTVSNSFDKHVNTYCCIESIEAAIYKKRHQYVLTICPYNMSSQYVLTICPHNMSLQYVLAICPCNMSLQYVLAICLVCILTTKKQQLKSVLRFTIVTSCNKQVFHIIIIS